jgi:hypothetical protein
MRTRTVFLLLALLGLGVEVASAQPILYSQAAYQGPVRADPDDLLLLPGDDLSSQDTVVYVAYHGPGLPTIPPSAVPTQSTATAGIAPIVSARGAPSSLTVLMPRVTTPGQPYAIWVRNRDDEWSNGIVINEPRPLWITPSFAYASARLASLPRQFKIVGRNLQPIPGQRISVRLIGPPTIEVEATQETSPAVHEYVIAVPLPERLQPGEYSVQLNRGDGRWLPVPQQLRVEADPATPVEYELRSDDYGACQPDDGHDDTSCLLRAIAAAQAAGGGRVVFGPGRWDVGEPEAQNPAMTIVVPRGVEMVGSGANQVRIVRHFKHTAQPAVTFVLMGNNLVSGITFGDSQRYLATEAASAMLQLGPDWDRQVRRVASDPVADIVITGNVFDRPGHAIKDSGLPLRNVFITYNRIGAYHTGLKLGGSRFNVAMRYRLDDSVIAYNSFIPGSYLDVPAGQGAMASEIGAGNRLDFSHNTADGAATGALDSDDDAHGWRAAFFWHMNDSSEMVLVSDNLATCTGDKAGDGEAFAYDSNANTYAFGKASAVVDATAHSITLAGSLKTRQNFRDVDAARFYVGHWLRILEGPGIGQVRRVDSYAVSEDGQNVTFQVSPAWDVVPRSQSLANVGREFWQVYTVGNVIDQRTPLCRKSNRSRPRGGALALWGQTSDSVVAGNRQYDTDGIVLHQGYRPDEPGCKDCTGWMNSKSFVELRGNLVDGEYDWNSDCSWSGIQLQYAAAPEVAPPTVSFGISIAHNEIATADGLRGGAISMPLTWYAGPPPHRWALIDNTLVHHNRIRNLTGPAARKQCDGASWERAGVKLAGADLAWRTVTYSNSCASTPIGYRHGGNETVNRCETRDADSCECR